MARLRSRVRFFSSRALMAAENEPADASGSSQSLELPHPLLTQLKRAPSGVVAVLDATEKAMVLDGCHGHGHQLAARRGGR